METNCATVAYSEPAPAQKQNLWAPSEASEGLLLASVPVLGYWFAYAYESSYPKNSLASVSSPSSRL